MLFAVTFTVAGLLRPGYSPVDQAISDLGIGDNAWAVNASMVVLGLSLVGFAVSFFRTVRPRPSIVFRLVTATLLASVGVGYAVAGIFDETSPLHWTVGPTLAIVGAILGFLLAGILLRRDRAWRGWGAATLLASLATLVLTGLMFYAFSSYTFTPGDPSGDGQLGGLMERVQSIETLAWYSAVGWRIFHGSPRSVS